MPNEDSASAIVLPPSFGVIVRPATCNHCNLSSTSNAALALRMQLQLKPIQLITYFLIIRSLGKKKKEKVRGH